MDSVSRLSLATIILHWLVASSILGLLCLGLYMTEYEQWSLYHTHKSLGILAISIVVVRIFWRIKNGWPAHVSDYSKAEMTLAKAVHWTLIISTLSMPLWGMLYSGASGHGFGIFSVEILHSNHSLQDPLVVVPLSEFWSDFGQTAHRLNGKVLIAAIVLHVIGAFKHHFMDKDSTLLRMFGRK